MSGIGSYCPGTEAFSAKLVFTTAFFVLFVKEEPEASKLQSAPFAVNKLNVVIF